MRMTISRRPAPGPAAALAAVLAAALLAGGCTVPPDAVTPAAPAAPAAAAGPGLPPAGAVAAADEWAAVQSVLREACSRDADCATAPVGSRPCGGPERWVAYAPAATDTAALQAALARHAQARADFHARRGAMSTCEVVADPGAVCRRDADAAAAAPGRCRTASPPGRGAATR